MILSSQTIERVCPLAPIQPRTRYRGVTFGLGPAGYDIRTDHDFLVWPGRAVLAGSVEWFQMPNDLLGVVHDKSTWARVFLLVQNTVIEPGWCGHLTLELTKSSFWRRPRRNWVEKWLLWWWPVFWVHGGTGIAQVIFHRLDEATAQPYEGKYQEQGAGPQPARFEQDHVAERASVLFPERVPQCGNPQGCPMSSKCVEAATCLLTYRAGARG